MCYSWQQIVIPGWRHPKAPSALMNRTRSGKACEVWVQKCAGWLSPLGPIRPLWGVIVVKSSRQGASSEQCSFYPNSLGHFHREVSCGSMETRILSFSTNARSRVGWLEAGARLQSPKLFLQWGIDAESSRKHLGRNELPAKYRLFHFEGRHPIYSASQSFSNF